MVKYNHLYITVLHTYCTDGMAVLQGACQELPGVQHLARGHFRKQTMGIVPANFR